MQRTIDIIISASTLIFLSPLMLLLAIIAETLTPGAFVRHNNRLKFRSVHWAVRHTSLDKLPALIDIFLGHHSFFDRKTRELFWPTETRTDTEFDWKWFSIYVVVLLLTALALYVIGLSVT